MSIPGQPATDAGQEERLIGSVLGMLDESLDPQPDLRQPQHLELLVLGRDGIAAPLAALALPVPGAVVAPSRPRRSRPMPAGRLDPKTNTRSTEGAAPSGWNSSRASPDLGESVCGSCSGCGMEAAFARAFGDA